MGSVDEKKKKNLSHRVWHLIFCAKYGPKEKHGVSLAGSGHANPISAGVVARHIIRSALSM